MPIDQYYRRKAYWIDRLGGACAKCGETEGLQFDHVDPSTKEAEISHIIGWSIAKSEPEFLKCQLLCGPCHKEKTRIENPRRGFMGELNDQRRAKRVCDYGHVDQYMQRGDGRRYCGECARITHREYYYRKVGKL